MDLVWVVLCTIMATLACVFVCATVLGHLASVQRQTFLDAPRALGARRVAYAPLPTRA